MMPGSDIDTIANADELWALVHAIQDSITKDGRAKIDFDTGHVDMDVGRPKLAELRRLADELDPDYGAY